MPRKVHSGQDFLSTPFGESTFLNNVIDVEAAYREGRIAAPSAAVPIGHNGIVVRVQNNTGSDRVRGDVVQIGIDLLNEKADGFPWFEGNAVTNPTETLYAILLQPLEQDSIGPAQVSGICVARVFVADTSDKYCRPTTTEVCVSKPIGPIRILSPLTTTGFQEVWVQLGRDENRVHYVTMTADIAPGESGTVTLPDGRDVDAENWSTNTALSIGDKCLCFEPAIDVFKLVKSGGEGGTSPRRFKGLITTPLRGNASTIGVSNVQAFDSQAEGFSSATVDVPIGDTWEANLGSEVFFSESPGLGGNGYVLTGYEPVARIVEGYVYQSFTRDSFDMRMIVTSASQGAWPLVGGVPVTNMRIRNLSRPVDPNNKGPYMFEGEFGGFVRAALWPEATLLERDALGVTFAYRTVYVECPEDSPVEDSPGASAPSQSLSDLYSSGGSPDGMAAAHYYGG